MIRNYKFIDLFAGCGGLSEGFYRKGYKALLHLEIDKAACKTLSTRMKHYGYSEQEIEEAVMCDDITREGLISDICIKMEIYLFIQIQSRQEHLLFVRLQEFNRFRMILFLKVPEQISINRLVMQCLR